LLDAGATGGEEEADATTVRILDAALEELLAFGLRRASIEDIARRAGVARITIYRRFPGKEDLVRSVVLREGRRVFAEVDAVVAGLSELPDQVAEGFAAILSATRSHPLLQRLLVTEADQTIASLTTHGGPVVALGREYLVGHLEVAREQGRLAAVDVRAVAEILVRLTLSFLLTPDSAIALHTPDDARAFARRYLVPALVGPTPGGPS
jgi:AcrR family transcriptional regulator